jgi:16S rRNA (guanine527-N7)-methyltransferase
VDSLAHLLAEGLAGLGIPATPAQQASLLEFTRLLRKWNRVYNLTAIENQAEMVRLHLLDSLSLLPYLNGNRVLDVGTGAGLPGIPLALLAPEQAFTLLDSNAKKTRFVRQAAIELGLANVQVEHARIEQYHPAQGFDTVLIRAFARLPLIVAETARLLNPGGVILAQKGKLPQEEITALENVIVEVFPLTVPGVDADRHLIAIKTQKVN